MAIGDLFHALRASAWERLCVVFWMGHDYMEDRISPYNRIDQCTNCGKIRYVHLGRWRADDSVIDWETFMRDEREHEKHGL